MRLFTSLLSCGTTVALIALAAPGTHAQVTSYSSRANFNTAATGTTTLTFEGAPAGNFTNLGNSTTISGVTFTTNTTLFLVDSSFSSPSYNYGTGDTLVADVAGASGLATLTALLPAGVTAVGTDFGNFNGGVFTVTLSTGNSFTLQGGQPVGLGGTGFNFAGFTSVTPITSITFSGQGNTGLAYDNFTFGRASVTAVPEPSEWLAMGMATASVGGLMIRARRRRSRNSVAIPA